MYFAVIGGTDTFDFAKAISEIAGEEKHIAQIRFIRAYGSPVHPGDIPVRPFAAVGRDR